MPLFARRGDQGKMPCRRLPRRGHGLAGTGDQGQLKCRRVPRRWPGLARALDQDGHGAAGSPFEPIAPQQPRPAMWNHFEFSINFDSKPPSSYVREGCDGDGRASCGDCRATSSVDPFYEA